MKPLSDSMGKIFVFILMMIAVSAEMLAQPQRYAKMSPLVRHAATSAKAMKKLPGQRSAARIITAFVRVESGDESVLAANGCKVWAQSGDIFIASIPLDRLGALSALDAVQRIEARESCSLLMDTTVTVVDADRLHSGLSLPQAFTGKGVVMGIQDVGFDLTNPNFYDTTMSEYRIKRFWDQLSTDTVGSNLCVGAEYVTRDEILSYAHSRDGLIQQHGCHTLGIAAGTGYDTPYRGMAYESDICLVSNAVNSDIELIGEDELYKYTSATDALGFKYIFDYAASVGKPCVISFSEGSHQGFYTDDQLFYEMLADMVGEGRIIVASAGNEGYLKSYFRKERGMESSGTFLYNSAKYALVQMQSDAPFTIEFTIYDSGESQKITIPTEAVVAAEDSTYCDTLSVFGRDYAVEVLCYPSCYDGSRMAYEVYIESDDNIGHRNAVSIEVVGSDADVEVYRYAGNFITSSINPSLHAGELTHCVYSPGSAPSVICVGATSYRTGTRNRAGYWMESDWGRDGVIAGYSSVGPTYDNRIKPDVVAPGTNVRSSYSSYYLEAHPSSAVNAWQVALSEFNGRIYPWNSDTGTSMSSPVVGGAVALWLQAVPTLTPEAVLGVLARTCSHYDETMEYPNNYYGYGEIDVYRGLLDILEFSSIDEISVHQPQAAHIIYNKVESSLSFLFDSRPQHPVTVSLYSASGAMLQKTVLDETNKLDISSLPRGIYAVQLSGSDKGVTGSTLVRKD